MELRWARRSDVPALLDLEEVFPGNRMRRRSFLRLAEKIRVADADGKLLGYSLVLLHARRKNARLYSIAVAPSARGRGIGAQLLADAEALALAAGRAVLSLEVRADNASAIRLYERAGYEVFGRFDGMYHDGADAVRMRRRLVDSPLR